MKSSFIIYLFFVFVLFNCQESENNSISLSTLDNNTNNIVQVEDSILKIIKKGGIPGLTCAVIKDSVIVYENGFGFRKKDSSMTNDKNTIFNAASLSKTVFAYLVMLLKADGLINLDRPLKDYLEKPIVDYPNYTDLSGDDRVNLITARMVLSHSTGFPNWRFLTDDGKLKFLFQPGSRFSYSGEGIHLLQMVIEKITGKGLQELAQQRIFNPFNMNHTSYIWQDEFEENYTFPHDKYERPGKIRRRLEADAAGSMQTTAGDYARFLQGLLQARGKEQVIVNEMFMPQISINSKRMFGPDAWNETNENASKKLSWALGWGYFESKFGRAIFHTGHDLGAQNYAVLYIDKGIGLVLMGNSDNLESVARQLAKEIIGDNDSPFDWLGYPHFDPNRDRTPLLEPVAIILPIEKLQRFTGEYSYLGNRCLIIKIENNALLTSDDRKEWTELFAETENRFFMKEENAKIIFKFDQANQVTGFNLLIEGIELPGEKIK
jgi:CubicO group peptidase (beta-lactamase class C family)